MVSVRIGQEIDGSLSARGKHVTNCRRFRRPVSVLRIYFTDTVLDRL